jgi:hypothetical protein
MAAAQVPRLFAREVASITWALGRCRNLLPQGSSSSSSSNAGRDAATQQLVRQLMQRLRHGGGRLLYQGATGAEVAKMLHGLARLKLGRPLQGSVQDLCNFVQRHPERMHAKELAAAAWALAKLRVSGEAVSGALGVISEQAVQRKVWLRPVSICSLATAWAQLGRSEDTQLLEALAEVRTGSWSREGNGECYNSSSSSTALNRAVRVVLCLQILCNAHPFIAVLASRTWTWAAQACAYVKPPTRHTEVQAKDTCPHSVLSPYAFF